MKKKIIGYTTGVFDLFHIGHLNILKNAKSHCDYLIVGVTTDQEVNRIKNKMPVICFEERKAIIESIRYVDKVIPEDDTDKIKAWTKYKFDVIFKGSDWKGTAKWDEYERQFSKVGVDVFYFTYTKETSSTKLREALDNINNYCDSRIS
jgi:glycerol-3-phosphate cytidylyltransferase